MTKSEGSVVVHDDLPSEIVEGVDAILVGFRQVYEEGDD